MRRDRPDALRPAIAAAWLLAIVACAVSFRPPVSTLTAGPPPEIPLLPIDALALEEEQALGGVALWRRLRGPPPATAAEAVALAYLSSAPGSLHELTGETSFDMLALAVLLDPAALSQVAATCPNATPALRFLCSPQARDQALAALDAIIARRLDSGIPHQETWAIDAAIGLARVPPGGSARALIVESWVAPPRAAIPRLRERLRGGGDAALIAALELGRLGDAASGPELAALAARLEGTAGGIVARYAHALATGSVHQQEWGRGGRKGI